MFLFFLSFISYHFSKKWCKGLVQPFLKVDAVYTVTTRAPGPDSEECSANVPPELIFIYINKKRNKEMSIEKYISVIKILKQNMQIIHIIYIIYICLILILSV